MECDWKSYSAVKRLMEKHGFYLDSDRYELFVKDLLAIFEVKD